MKNEVTDARDRWKGWSNLKKMKIFVLLLEHILHGPLQRDLITVCLIVHL